MESSSSEISSSNILVSPVTLQVQKHLLSSTVHTISDTGKGKAIRNGSCSPTPALPYTPTPSPSTFNSLGLGISSSDLNLSLSADTKSINFLGGGEKGSVFSSSSSNFVDLDVCDGGRPQSLGSISLTTRNSQSSADISSASARYSPPIELNPLLDFSAQNSVHIPVSSQHETLKDYLVMETVNDSRSQCGSVSIIPNAEANTIRLVQVSEPRKQMELVPVSINVTPTANLTSKSVDGIRVVSDLQSCLSPIKSAISQQMACMTALPAVTSQQLTYLTNASSAVTSLACLPSIDSLRCLSASSTNAGLLTPGGSGFDNFRTSSIIPNKKRRLLTFLSSEDNDLNNLSNIETTMNDGKPAQDSTLIINSSDEPLVAATKTPNTSTLLLSNRPLEKTNNSVYLGPTQSLTKSEQTLIINSDGTPAALLTPVTVPQTQASSILNPENGISGGLVAGASADLVSANQILNSNNLIANQTSATINFRPVATNTFTVESLTSQNNQDCPNFSNSNVIRHNNSNINENIYHTVSEYVECISLLKCKLCGFLSISSSGIDEHLFDEHDKEMANSKLDDEDSWQKIASKEGIKLNCPMCQNVFNSEKSFQVHLTEDHNLSESLALSRVTRENYARKSKTLNIIRTKKERLRQERKRNRKHGFEAYLDSGGELRIRRIAALVGDESGQVDSINSSYIDSEQTNVKKDDKNLKRVFDMKASDYVDFITNKVDEYDETLNNSVLLIANDNSPVKVNRPRTGRPKGSKNLGITKIRKVNPQVTISDDIMGYECGVDGCAVRLKDMIKLELHRDCHKNGGTFKCPECDDNFVTWPKCALHIWRAHNQDMELYSCQKCQYKSFFKSTMDKHNFSHIELNPCLCPECGRAVKNERQLKEHMKTVHKISLEGTKIEFIVEHSCDICQQTLCSERELKRHKERVHEKKREWLCSHCGFSSFSRSSLKLHVRTHTGDKPYKCKDCDYRASDHNTLRRHSLRHGGVKPYQCPHCPYSAIQSTMYKVHLKKKHPDLHSKSMLQCTKCDFVTMNQLIFTNHKLQHQDIQTKSDPTTD